MKYIKTYLEVEVLLWFYQNILALEISQIIHALPSQYPSLIAILLLGNLMLTYKIFENRQALGIVLSDRV